MLGAKDTNSTTKALKPAYLFCFVLFCFVFKKYKDLGSPHPQILADRYTKPRRKMNGESKARDTK